MRGGGLLTTEQNKFSRLMKGEARNTEADVNVIALVGERGHEVRDYAIAKLDAVNSFLKQAVTEKTRRSSIG